MTTFDPSTWRIPSSDTEWFFDDPSPEFRDPFHAVFATIGELFKGVFSEPVRNLGKSLHTPPPAIDLAKDSIFHWPYGPLCPPRWAAPPYFTILDEVATWQASLTEEEPPIRTCRRHGLEVLGSGLCPACRREQVLSTGRGSSSRMTGRGLKSGGGYQTRSGRRSSGKKG